MQEILSCYFFVSMIHCTKSSCRKLALANIIERFYDFDEIELAIAVLLTFSHEDFFPGRCKIIEFFYDD